MSKHIWTETTITKLETEEIRNLLRNAHSKGAFELVQMCEEELKRRQTKVPTPRKTRTSSLKNYEEQISAEIGAFARKLAQDYDLSPETASKVSRGIKGFRTHSLTDKHGNAKLGGHERLGLCQLDRYVSYRVRDHYVSLGVWLPKGRRIDEVEFQVFGTKELLPQGVAPAELRPNLPERDSEGTNRRGVSILDLESAKTEFARLIAAVAPKRN
jgi:hypothetical protein